MPQKTPQQLVYRKHLACCACPADAAEDVMAGKMNQLAFAKFVLVQSFPLL